MPLRHLALSVALALIPSAAWACPMCSQVLNEEQVIPRAFYVSILFMLGMPPLVLGGIGFAIWRAHRKHALLQQAMQVGETLES